LPEPRVVVHPTIVREQNETEKYQFLISKMIGTLAQLPPYAFGIEEDLSLVMSRCAWTKARGLCNHCIFDADGECVAKKYKDLFVDEFGWTKEITDEFLSLSPDKEDDEDDDEHSEDGGNDEDSEPDRAEPTIRSTVEDSS
jgi:hypothetical protein